MRYQRRTAFSLLELLVVVAIFAILIGLMLPAIQRVRQSASRMQSASQLRQIGIGLNHYAGVYEGRLPGFVNGGLQPNSDDVPPLDGIEPYVELVNLSRSLETGVRVPLYLDPADPTVNVISPNPLIRPVSRGNTSYAANMVAFTGRPNIGTQFPDGTSTTIAMAGHYARSGSQGAYNFVYTLRSSGTFGDVGDATYILLNQVRRGTFADLFYGDVVPVTVDGRTNPSRPGATFQITPTPEACDPSIPQTPHAAGMLTLQFDGSVRLIRPQIDPSIFWAAVTRNGGEVTNLD